MALFALKPRCPVCNEGVDLGNSREGICKVCKSELYLDEDNILQSLKVFKVEERQKSPEKMAQAVADAKKSGDYSELSTSEIESITADIVLTTAFSVNNRTIAKEIEIVSAECVYGMHIFKDFFGGVRDIFGGRSKAIQDTLRDARKTAMAELRREALMVGGDAVIGVDLDYQEITGGGKGGMIMLVASGTAVKLK